MSSSGVPTRPSQLTQLSRLSNFRVLSTTFVLAGLFTASWDRFAQLFIGSFNVKLPTILFIIALVLTFADAITKRARLTRSPIVGWAFAVVVAFAALGLFAVNVLSAQVQAIVIVLGALIPFLAVFWNISMYPDRLDLALTAFIRGGWFAAIFGLYQLCAFYTGLPQIVEYEAQGGGLGRISAFSYESGYFGYFMILVIAAMFARAALRKTSVNMWHLLFMIGVLLLANSRATFLTLPLLFILLLFTWPKKVQRTRLWPIIIVGVWVLIIVVIAVPDIALVALERAGSLLDPTEETSNAPRLNVLSIISQIITDYPIVGVGGGNLIEYYGTYGGYVDPGASANSLIANNMWYQALLDGGVILLALEILFVVVAAATLFRRKRPVSRALLAGWIAVILPASLVTSFYFDMKLWVALALALAAASILPDDVHKKTAIVERNETTQSRRVPLDD